MNFKAYIEKWIIPHRRGIMGTVIFHLVLAIFLLSMEISRIQVHTEMEIVMDTPTPEERQKKRGRAATKRGNSSKDFSGRGRTHVAFHCCQ